MHSIERYGIVALLFLVVTVVAVLMWDGNKEKPAEVTGSAPLALTAPPEALTTDDEAARLSLLAEGQPGPLQRRPRGPRASAGEGAQEFAGRSVPHAAASQGELTELTEEGALSENVYQTPQEEPAPEQVIGRLSLDEPPPSAPAPVVPATHAYAVRAGDTLSEIAQRELGSSRRWQELVAANPGLDPAKLRVGKTIQIPGAKAAGQPATASAGSSKSAAKDDLKTAKKETAKKDTAPAAGSGKTWKVGKGENLWRIAERALGDGKRWGEIAKLNPKVNPDKLVQGQVLVLPAAAATTAAPGKKSSGPTVAATPPKAKPKSEPVLLASSSGRRGGKVK
jgi:nucleoid-associated protein YgaU